MIAVFTALCICFAFVAVAFSIPDNTKVKADFGDIGSVADFGDDLLEMGAAGLTASEANSSFAAAFGIQLALYLIGKNVQDEHANYPTVSYDFSDFQAVTGYYKKSDNPDKYYPMTWCIDKYFVNHYSGGKYPGFDGGWTLCTSPDITIKWFVTDAPYGITFNQPSSPLSAGFGTAYAVYGVNKYWFTATSDTITFNSSLPNINSKYNATYYFRFDGVPTFNISGTNISAYCDSSSPSAPAPIMGYVSQPLTWQDLPSFTIDDPAVDLPDIYNDYIIPNYPPDHLVYPDGWPGTQEPTTEETTEETTESPSDLPYPYQPFTLPPEWLETYEVYPSEFPTLPIPSEEELPTFAIDEDGVSDLDFWRELMYYTIDSAKMRNWIIVILILSIVEFVLWRIGSSRPKK